MKGIIRVVGSFLTFIMCILIFIVVLGLHSILFAKGMLNENNISNIVNKMDLTLLLEDNKGNETSFYSTVVSALEDLNFSDATIEGVVASDGVKNIFATIINNTNGYLLSNTRDEILTISERENLINNNIDNILAFSNLNLTDDNKDKLVNVVNLGIDSWISSVKKLSNENIQTFHLVFSWISIAAMIAIVVILTLFIAIFKWNMGKALRNSGMTILLASIIALFVSGLVYISYQPILKNVDILMSFVDFIKPIINSACIILVINAVIMIVISLILLGVGIKLIDKIEVKEEIGTILEEW